MLAFEITYNQYLYMYMVILASTLTYILFYSFVNYI